jgi:hypothetical protein
MSGLLKHKFVVRGGSPYCDVDGCERLEDDNIHNVMLLADMIEERETIIIGDPPAPGPLDRKEWAVIYDDGATCDLTYQEARQMCKALAARDINSATIVTNNVGKLARDKGFLRTPEMN